MQCWMDPWVFPSTPVFKQHILTSPSDYVSSWYGYVKNTVSIYRVQHRADILRTPPSRATRLMTVGDTDNGILCAECQQKASIFLQVD